MAAVAGNFDSAAPNLDGIIKSTFAVQGLMHRDPTTQIGQKLAQALNQVSSAGSRVYAGWTVAFVEMADGVAQAGGLRPDVDPVDVGEAIWAGVLGSHLVSAACGDDPYVRLARSWRLLVLSTAPQHEVVRLHELLDDTVESYQAPV